MIAMSMISVYEEYRRDRVGAVQPEPAHEVRRAMLRVLSMIGLGVGGVAAMDDEMSCGSADDCAGSRRRSASWLASR